MVLLVIYFWADGGGKDNWRHDSGVGSDEYGVGADYWRVGVDESGVGTDESGGSGLVERGRGRYDVGADKWRVGADKSGVGADEWDMWHESAMSNVIKKI